MKVKTADPDNPTQHPDCEEIYLYHWACHFRNIEHSYKTLKKLTGASPDSTVFKTMYGMFRSYTDMVAAVIGDNDGWLHWFIWENDCGRKKLKAKASTWKKPRTIRNTNDLLKLIWACPLKGIRCPLCRETSTSSHEVEKFTVGRDRPCTNLHCEVKWFRNWDPKAK